MNCHVLDTRSCALGEGPFWHPHRQAFFWFDILEKRLLSTHQKQIQEWQLPFMASAAGIIDQDRLLLSTERGLLRYHLNSGEYCTIMDIEADNPITRANDGRVDRQGGFWCSTMGYNAEEAAGTIYRYYAGELRVIRPRVSIPNAICFAPDGTCAYFADTTIRTLYRQPLDVRTGWPEGEATILSEFANPDDNPDGAITDTEGNLWIAMWGSGAVVKITPDGEVLARYTCPTRQTTCPAAGGDDYSQLIVTSAHYGLSRNDHPNAGKTFMLDVDFSGIPERPVLLP